MHVTGWSRYQGILVFALVLLTCSALFAGVTASIAGTVKDATGASVAGATVTATNAGTGVSQTQSTNAQGYYSFQYLPIGTYDIVVQQRGFKAYRRSGVVLNVNDALVVDAPLQVGEVKETVNV